ncbi:MAG: hypothetical protein ACI8Z1_003937 [Candidatus Azotimanducaceae bacterium]|jgi:hypothetical protein
MMEFIADLMNFMKVHKNYWLMPITFVLVLFGGLLFVTQGSVIAPFIYTLF